MDSPERDSAEIEQRIGESAASAKFNCRRSPAALVYDEALNCVTARASEFCTR